MTAKKAISAKDMGNNAIINLPNGVNPQDAATKSQVDAAQAYAANLSNATGTTDHTKISDWTASVTSFTLAQFAVPGSDVSWNSHKITSLLDPTNPQDASTKNYVDTSLAAQAAGLVFKGEAKAATTTNITISGPGTTIDGKTAVAGDVFVLMGQTTGSQNGAWVWNGAAAAMTRPSNFSSTAANVLVGSMWIVASGTYDNQIVILSNDTFTLGTDTGTFAFLNPAAGAASTYSASCPATSAGSSWPVVHNLGTQDVLVTVYQASSPYAEVDAYVTHDSTTQVSVWPDVAVTAGQYRVVVKR